MGLDREMKPKRIPVSLIILLLGVVVAVIGSIWWANTDIGKYLDLRHVSIEQTLDGIDNLKIEVGTSKLIIKQGGDKIKIEADNVQEDDYRFSTQDGTYYIIPSKSDGFSLFSFNNKTILPDKYRPTVTVTIPDKLFKKIDFKLGVGETEIDGLKADEMEIDIGVGEATFTNITVNDRFDADVGVGHLKFSGDVKGKMDIDVGVGDADFTFDGYYNDYRIDQNTGIGDFDLDRGDTSQGGNANIPIKVDLGVGNIDMRFK